MGFDCIQVTVIINFPMGARVIIGSKLLLRQLLLLIIAFVALLPSLAEAYDILVLQSSRASGYEETLNGFRSGQNVSLRVIVLTDYAEVDVVRIVREDRPRIILTLGDAALTVAHQIKSLPVVAVMSLGINNSKYTASNLTGISMFVHPERYVSMFRSMKIRRVGVIYSEEKSGWYLQLSRKAASAAGIELVVREVSAPQETIEKLTTLAGKVDALWMLPDTTAVSRENSEAYFRFGMQKLIPVISFAPVYLDVGAAAVLEIDRFAMGRQAFAMTAKLLKSGPDNKEKMKFSFPQKTEQKNNPAVLKRLAMKPEQARNIFWNSQSNNQIGPTTAKY